MLKLQIQKLSMASASLGLPRPPPQPIYCLKGNETGEISSVCFHQTSSGEEQLLSGSTNGKITVWSLQTFRASSSWIAHDNKPLLWLGCHGNKIISQGRDGSIRKWENNAGNWIEIGRLISPKVGFCTCDVTEVGTMVIPMEESSKLRLTSVASDSVKDSLTLENETETGMCMCVKAFENPSTQTPSAIAGFEDGSIAFWDGRKAKTPVYSCRISVHKEPVMCLDFDSFSFKGISGSAEEHLSNWQLNHDPYEKEKIIPLTNPGISAIKIRRKDRRICVSGGWDGRIRIFDWKKKLKPLAVLDYHTQTVRSIDFSNGSVNDFGFLIAAGSKDERISLWNVYGK